MNKENEELNIDLTYALDDDKVKRQSIWRSTKEFLSYLKGNGGRLSIGLALTLVNAGAEILTPYIIAYAIDNYIRVGNISGLSMVLLVLAGIYLIVMISGYVESVLTGLVSQDTLFRLRQSIFTKLQELPIAFFNQNKAGDLMSRINGDTEKLNQFLSDSLLRFLGSFFSIFGIAVFVFFINIKLAMVMVSVAIGLFVFIRILTPLFEKLNKKSLTAVGSFNASIQENLTNFRVIVAYSKRDYFKKHLEKSNNHTYKSGIRADFVNKIFEPIFDFSGGLALVLVLSYGLFLFGQGEISIGILIAFVTYTQRFYNPLQYLATIIGEVQVSLAAWSRVRAVLHMKNNLNEEASHDDHSKHESNDSRLELRDVSFGYEGGGMVIENANLSFKAGKTYALVGPTGGGKSTLASLMARLYDPLTGEVFLNGHDIKTYKSGEKSKIVSVILQDPILFSGTVSDNIKYGNDDLSNKDDIELQQILKQKGFEEVLGRFEHGLSTAIASSGGGLSIGQKQLISFMRAILREPKLLILDEATANIDTVTEAMLNKTLEALPKDTTKVIIAHRLNTIKEADEIMFVNGHHVTKAGSFDDAIRLIESSKRSS